MAERVAGDFDQAVLLTVAILTMLYLLWRATYYGTRLTMARLTYYGTRLRPDSCLARTVTSAPTAAAPGLQPRPQPVLKAVARCQSSPGGDRHKARCRYRQVVRDDYTY